MKMMIMKNKKKKKKKNLCKFAAVEPRLGGESLPQKYVEIISIDSCCRRMIVVAVM
jgi:hypothetical protein